MCEHEMGIVHLKLTDLHSNGEYRHRTPTQKTTVLSMQPSACKMLLVRTSSTSSSSRFLESTLPACLTMNCSSVNVNSCLMASLYLDVISIISLTTFSLSVSCLSKFSSFRPSVHFFLPRFRSTFCSKSFFL